MEVTAPHIGAADSTLLVVGSIRRLIAVRVLMTWKRTEPKEQKWLIDEFSLSRLQVALIDRARTKAAPVQQSILQGELTLW